MSLADMIDAAVRCTRCGATLKAGCGCWSKCACGRTKGRGPDRCPRCAAVKPVRVAPSRYEAAVGPSRVTTWKTGIHWTYSIACGCGCGVERDDGRLFRTNKDAMAVGIAEAFKMLDDAARRPEGRNG